MVAPLLAATLALSNPMPTPVGKGPRYTPPARPATARFSCRKAPLHAGGRVHVELFARRRVVVVPAGIGLRRPRLQLGRVISADCRAPVWTLDPSGVVRFEGGATLADVFRVWGEPLARARLASFRGRVSVYVAGVRRRGDPRKLRLRDGEEIVLELGGYVRPHRSFLFPP